MTSSLPSRRTAGMTLVELLTVIAVIGILTAILIPTVGHVREKARTTATRATFSQLSTAIGLYKTEYGYFPRFNTDTTSDWSPNATNGDIATNDATTDLVVQALTGYTIAGKKLNDPDLPTNTPTKSGNLKMISFLKLTSDIFLPVGSSGRFVDSYGNQDIRILMDVKNPDDTDDKAGDGMITIPKDFGARSVLTGTEVSFVQESPRKRVRAPVILYSAGGGAPDKMVTSW